MPNHVNDNDKLKINGTRVVFLDRDGVINEFPGNGKYVTTVKDFRFLPRTLSALQMLSETGHTLFVVSNQAGVGRGVFSREKLDRITDRMIKIVERSGGEIRKVYYCTHRPDAGCSCRKPGIGNIDKAFQSLNRTMRSAKHAFFVGDTKSDIETGYNAGCRTIFVLSGRENRRYMRQWIIKPDFIAKDLMEAAKIIMSCNGVVPKRPVDLRKKRA